ncbi:MAG TPA: hypothetical protein VF215_06385, partial [Thermoanaerobaculia bacterium]
LYFVLGRNGNDKPLGTVVNGGCTIAPPKDAKVNREVALKVAADLSKLTKMPASGETQITAKNTAEQTFQLLPDADVACHMLLQTITCLSAKPGNEATVQSLVSYMKEGDKCGPQAPPKNAYQVRIQGQAALTNSDKFELDLGFVEAGKELTIPIDVIARLPGNPPLKITHREQPLSGKWENGSDAVVASEQSPGVLVLSVPAQQPNTELRSEVRVSPNSPKPFPTMTLAVHLHALPATQTVSRSSGSRPSGRGKDFSGVYSICADAPTQGNYVHVSNRFWLTGDRECNAYSNCDRTVDPAGKQVCMQFTLQGHDECLGPFANCDATRDSEGHVEAIFRLVPSPPTLRVAA